MGESGKYGNVPDEAVPRFLSLDRGRAAKPAGAVCINAGHDVAQTRGNSPQHDSLQTTPRFVHLLILRIYSFRLLLWPPRVAF